jgi:hypothetical protein
MQSKATTVADYLASLPEDRRKAVEAVRKVIRANLDKQYEEGVQYGMIGYYVPHKFFPPATIATRSSRCRLPRWPRRKITCRCI